MNNVGGKEMTVKTQVILQQTNLVEGSLCLSRQTLQCNISEEQPEEKQDFQLSKKHCSFRKQGCLNELTAVSDVFRGQCVGVFMHVLHCVYSMPSTCKNI